MRDLFFRCVSLNTPVCMLTPHLGHSTSSSSTRAVQLGQTCWSSSCASRRLRLPNMSSPSDGSLFTFLASPTGTFSLASRSRYRDSGTTLFALNGSACGLVRNVQNSAAFFATDLDRHAFGLPADSPSWQWNECLLALSASVADRGVIINRCPGDCMPGNTENQEEGKKVTLAPLCDRPEWSGPHCHL